MHDYHLIPFASELRKLGVQNAIGFYLHIPFPPWQTFMAIPEHQQLARDLSAYDLVGLQTKADVGNLMRYLENGVFGRIVPDGRIRVFDRLVSIASFPVGIDVDDFANAKRDAGLVQARDCGEPHHRHRPPRLHQGAAAQVQGLRTLPRQVSAVPAARWC